MKASDNAVTWSIKMPVTVGVFAIILLLLGLGAWGGMVKISGAIVSSGIIQVESLRQIVQHPQGGVVGEINVKNGQSVTAGETLIRFDDKFLRPNISILERQLTELIARKTRLRAERDGEHELSFQAQDWIRDIDAEAMQDILTGQLNLFHARLDSFVQTKEQLLERQKQTALQLDGSKAQKAALGMQIELIGKERVDQESLLEKGLAQGITHLGITA